jgi:hypothetical protein
MDTEEQTGRPVTQLAARAARGDPRAKRVGVERPRVAAAADNVRVVLRQRAKEAAARNRQRGWVGMIIVLVALVIVAFLAQSALRQYGVLPARVPVAKPGDLPRGPGIGAAPLDPTEATSAPATPIERARDLERTLQRDTQDLQRRIDEQSK